MKRLKIHKKLVDFADANGIRKVYFEPPAGIQMEYPCIVYRYTNINSKSADNQAYIRYMGYNINLMTKDPDSEVITEFVDALSPYVRFTGSGTNDNIHHYYFTCYEIY